MTEIKVPQIELPQIEPLQMETPEIEMPETVSPPAGGPLFTLGRVVATPAALSALNEAGVSPDELLGRHARGDWGDLCEDDRQMNEEALASGDRLLSAYAVPTGERLWIVTEADRSATTVLLPSDY